MKLFKKTSFVALAIGLSLSSCFEKDDSCDDCIAAQKHLYGALTTHLCSVTTTATAAAKVKDACGSSVGSAKISYLVKKCQLAEVPSYDCD